MCETCAHRFRIRSKHQRQYNNILPVEGTLLRIYCVHCAAYYLIVSG